MAPTATAVVRFAAPAAEVRRRTGGALGEPEPIAADACRLRTPADALDWLALRLLICGLELTVEEPPELVDRLREIGSRARRAGSEGSSPDRGA
ncbi:hypothetical protein DSM104299_01020 [Baekduia alba]|uniref:WYL domain-containing protein n=1 Tax=Baekduia alba TaxID=2997333 RepID=UPI0032C3FFBE|nr:hypothetical protein DSM104299_01020 [Baekduia alba]